jgi:DNA-directed RNA polymerase specialized sigma subunit, sigma24 homolog
MLKAIAYREQFINPANLKAWTYTIMRNTFINNYRKAVRHSVVTDPTKNLYFQNKSRDNYDFAPDTYYAANEISLLIDKLPDEFRIPFKMMLEGYKYKDIADKLGLKLGTVKSRIFFTRKMLMDSLKEYSDESRQTKVSMG